MQQKSQRKFLKVYARLCTEHKPSITQPNMFSVASASAVRTSLVPWQTVGSVGDHKSGSKFERANVGAANNNPTEMRINPTEIRIPPDLGRSKSGRALKLTYAQAVAE